MAYRIGIDEEEKKRQNLVTENRAFRERYTSGGGLSQGTVKVQVDLSQYKPSDIADLGYRMPKEQRAQFLDFAQGYYKKVGAQNIPKADDISAQWDEWDANRESALSRMQMQQSESALGVTGMNKISALGTIAGMMKDGDTSAAMSAYADLTGTKGSQYYTPYAKATSQPLETLGVESVDDAWFAANEDYVNDLLYDEATGGVKKPGASATDAQKRAYAIFSLRENEETTKTAEAEMETLYAAIAEEAGYAGFDAKAYIDEINWKDYPTLKKMLDGAYTGEYVQLNRSVPFSTEALYGVAYCAQKGITPTDAREYELYAGAYVNDLKKNAKLGTDEEEPEGFLETIGDFVTGEKSRREDRIAQGEDARARLDALGVGYTLEEPEQPGKTVTTESGEVYQPEELADAGFFMKPRTQDDMIKAFREGNYGFVENAQDRNTLHRIDEQIELLLTEKEEVNATRVANGKGATDDRLNAISVQLGRLNSKKMRIAFAGSGETLEQGNITARRQFEPMPGRTAGLEITPDSADALLDRYAENQSAAQERAQQQAESSQNMKPPIGWGTTEFKLWQSASTDGEEKVLDEFERAMAEADKIEDPDERLDAKLAAEDAVAEGTYAAQVRARVLQDLIPKDEETAAIRAGAEPERITLLCEREIASAMGDDEKVQAITNALIEAGYPECWPEDEAIIAQERADSIAYAKNWGDAAVRERLGYPEGRALTDEDYYQAAHTDKGFWEWLMQGWEAGAEYRAQPKKTVEELTKELYEQAEEYEKKVEKQGAWETFYSEIGTGFYGGTGSVEQKEAATDVAAVPGAVTAGAVNGVTGALQGAADMAEAFAYEAARAQYGNLTREQMAMISPEYKLISGAKKALDKGVGVITPDVSQRSGWVQTIGSLTESVMQNVKMAKAGSIAGKLGVNLAKRIGIDDVKALQNVFARASKITSNMGFTLSGMKTGLAEAKTMGLEGEDAINYAIVSAGISMGVENISIDPLTKASRVMNAIPDGVQAAPKGWKEWVKKTGRTALNWTVSGLGEAAEEAIESPAQKINKVIMADQDMKIFGEGGIIDTGEMAESGAMGFAAGVLLSALGGAGQTQTSKVQGEVKASMKPESTQTQTQAENAVETVENAEAESGAEIESAQQTGSAQSQSGGEVRTMPEQIQRKAQDYVTIMSVAQDPDADEDVIAFAQLAAEEVAAKGGMEAETRATLESMLAINRIKSKMAMEDVTNAAKIYGSEVTSQQTKQMAEDAMSGMGKYGFDAQTRKALAQSAARDAAKAQAQASMQQVREELQKATKDEKAVRKEYGQMTGRLKALSDNATQIINQGLSGTMTKELQGQYETLMNKMNSMQKRVENQRARMSEAKTRMQKAQAAYDMAAAQAKIDEELLYQQMISAGAKTEEAATGAEKQTQMEAQPQQATPEEVLERETIEALEEGDEASARAIQAAAAQAKSDGVKAAQDAQQMQQASEAEETAKRDEYEVWDRYEDYDVKGLKKYLKSSWFYVDDQQAGEMLHMTGLKSLSAVNRQYGTNFTKNRAKASSSLDGQMWADVASYLDEHLANPQEYHPETRILEILDDIKRNEAEMKDKRNVFHSLRTRKKRAGIGGEGARAEVKTEQAIGEDLQRAFPGITVRGESAFANVSLESGATDIGTGGIRIVGHRNIADMAHEIGHRLSLKSGINTAERTAGGRIREGTVQVAEQYRMPVDAMVEKIAQEEPGFFSNAAYATQEAKRQEAIAEFYNRYMEGGEDAARQLAGKELFELLDGAMTKAERKALRQAHEDLSVLDANRTISGERSNVVSKATQKERRIKEAARKGLKRGEQLIADINHPLIDMDKRAVESVMSRMTPEQRKRFIELNRERGGTNLLILDDEALKKYLESGELEQKDEDTVYNIASNLTKAAGIVDVWIRDKIVTRDNRELLDTNISEIIAPLEEEDLTEFGMYHQYLQELDARNLRDAHMKAFYAAKAAAPQALKDANAEYHNATEEVKRRQEAVNRYSGRTDEGAKKALANAQQELASALEWKKEALAARMAAEENVKKTEGEYRPQTNDSYRSDWGDLSKEQIEEIIAKYEKTFPEFKKVHEGLRRVYNVLMEEYMIKPGYIENAQTAWENVTAARPHYLPTQYVEVQSVREKGLAEGTNKAQRRIQSAKAGDRDVVNPVAGLIEDLHRMVDVEGKMRMKNKLAFYYDTYANMGDYMREITDTNDDIEMERSLAAGQAAKTAQDMDATLWDLLAQSGTKKSEERVMVAIENGQARYFEIVDQHLYDALEYKKKQIDLAVEIRAVKEFKRAWQTLNKAFRTLTTSGNLGFGLKNVKADAITAAVMTQDKTLKGRFTDYWKSMWDVARAKATGQMTDEIRLYAAMGGMEGDALSHDVQGERKRQRELMKMKNEADTLRKKVLQGIKNFNDIMEAGTRYNEFRRGRKMGMTNERAFRMSQESTSDFSRTGLKTREVAQYFYFANAGIQGTYDVIHAFEMEAIEPGRTKKMLARVVLRGMAGSLAYEIIRNLFWDEEDKERYDNMEENVKRENFVVWMPDGKAIIIPKGRNILFTAADIPRDIMAGIAKEIRDGGDVYSYLMHELGADMAEWVKALVDDVNPFGSSVFATALALGTNTNYWGEDIEPEWMEEEGLDAHNRTDERTSVIANALSYVIPLSPKKIHYMIDQQFGWAGDLLLNATTPSKGYQSMEESEGLADYLGNLALNTLGQFASSLIKSYVRPSNAITDLQTDFYDYKDFMDGTVSQYEEFKGAEDAAWKNKDRIAYWLSDRERQRAYEDAKDMSAYLKATQKAVKEKTKQMEKYPEEIDRFENEIVQMLIAANHYAESWQRRYMDGDLTVKVMIPKGDW